MVSLFSFERLSRTASFALSSVAGITVVASAQAADLPMRKAEPVEYVKVCSEFGDGYYYIPASDTCLSVNGYVRADYWWFDPDSRSEDGLRFYTKGLVAFDARTATEYGTLRSYLSFQYTHGDPGTDNTVTAERAFLQFGGWTAGYATSFYNFYDAEVGSTLHGTYFSSFVTTHLLAYTAVFGSNSELAATLSLEDNYYRRSGISDPYGFLFNQPGWQYGGQRAPDVVASLRWTEDWGSAQVMAAAHETRNDLTPLASQVSGIGADQEWGYAIGAGFLVNLPSGFFFALEGNYARGAVSYVGLATDDPDVLDGALNRPDGQMDLSRAWSATADLGYNFTPSLVGHLVGSYASYDSPEAAEFGEYGVDFETWAATANLSYTIVRGLTIAGEVSYETRDYDRTLIRTGLNSFEIVDGGYDVWAGGVRLRRSF